MRLLLAVGLWFTLASLGTSFGQAPAKIADPKVRTQPVDHCADIDASADCTAKGEAKAALNACIANGYAEATGWHTRPASGTAMHFVTEYDMHAGEVGGRWESRPSTGIFDWISCKK
jgi:hypothetical protein